MQNVVHGQQRNPAEETGEMPALFGTHGGEAPQPRPRVAAGPDFAAIQASPEFATLRGRFRRFAFPMTLLFIAWYLLYVALAAYAHGFMSTKIIGEVNVAILMGVLQFVSTALITLTYLRFARRRLDPQVEVVRRQAGV